MRTDNNTLERLRLYLVREYCTRQSAMVRLGETQLALDPQSDADEINDIEGDLAFNEGAVSALRAIAAILDVQVEG